MSFLTTTDHTGISLPAEIDYPPVVKKEQDIEMVQCNALKAWLADKGASIEHVPGRCSLCRDTICYLSEMLEDHKDRYALIITKHDVSWSGIQNYARDKDIGVVVDLVQLNYTRYINKYLEKINAVLPNNSLYLGCVETNCQRNRRLYSSCGKLVAGICIFWEFLLHRILPKIQLFQKLYFKATKGRYRFLTTAEALGRIVCCGFRIQNFQEIDNLTYYQVAKVKTPYFDNHANYGPLIKLRRVGKDGNIFDVYKFRTMHPYSEYLQDYFVQHYGYNECGKPAHDFRIAFWGRFMRRYWIDEVPQLFNLLRGDMKIMGVRPLSIVRFSEFPKDLQELRIKHKTGCIPPYVALNMPSAKDNMEAERIYLHEREEHPILTDLKYISMAVYNIITNKIRSS